MRGSDGGIYCIINYKKYDGFLSVCLGFFSLGVCVGKFMAKK